MTRSLPAYRTGARFVLAVALAVCWVVVPAGGSEAHNVLRSTSPVAGAVLETLPAEVVLTFDPPARAGGAEILVRGPAGPVQSGKPALVDTTVRQSLEPGPAGSYTVTWRATSADGHPVSGSFCERWPDVVPEPVAAAPSDPGSDGVLVLVAAGGFVVALTAGILVVVRARRRRV